MTDTLVSPSRTISVGDTSYKLDGSFGTLRAVQEAFKLDILHLVLRIVEMRFDEISRLIAIGSGQPDKVNEIGQIIQDEIGAIGSTYALLKNEVFAWLNVAMSPKSEREKKTAEMDEMLRRSRSRGTTTSESPSAPSAGSQASSGEATPGS